jgi:hypothetical protein
MLKNQVRDNLLKVKVSGERVEICNEQGSSLVVCIYGSKHNIVPGACIGVATQM